LKQNWNLKQSSIPRKLRDVRETRLNKVYTVKRYNKDQQKNSGPKIVHGTQTRKTRSPDGPENKYNREGNGKQPQVYLAQELSDQRPAQRQNTTHHHHYHQDSIN